MLALDSVFSGAVVRGVRLHEATGPESRDAEALTRTVHSANLCMPRATP